MMKHSWHYKARQDWMSNTMYWIRQRRYCCDKDQETTVEKSRRHRRQHLYLYKLVYKRSDSGIEDILLTAVLIMNKVKVKMAELHSARNV